jgi:hypothetical protein
VTENGLEITGQKKSFGHPKTTRKYFADTHRSINVYLFI